MSKQNHDFLDKTLFQSIWVFSMSFLKKNHFIKSVFYTC